MAYSSALPKQSGNLSTAPRDDFQITDWPGLRKQLLLLHPGARPTKESADVRTEERLPGAIHGAAANVIHVCEAIGRKIEVEVDAGLTHTAPPQALLPRLTDFLRSILCVGTGDIQINATLDRGRPFFCLRIAGAGLEVSDEARLCVLALAHSVGATTSIVTAKAESAVAFNVPFGGTPAATAN